MFAGVCNVDGHLRVKIVRRGDGNSFNVIDFQHLAIIDEDTGYIVAVGEFLCMAGRGRGNGDDLGTFRNCLESLGMTNRLKLRTDDSDFYA